MKETKQWAILCVLFGILFVGCMMGSGDRTAAYTKEREDLAKQIVQAQTKLGDLEDQLARAEASQSTTLNETEQTTALHSAQEVGAQVAAVQNQYQVFTQTKDSEGLKTNAATMETFLTEGAKAARVPWFSGTVPHTWSFVSDASFAGNVAQVVWVCEDQSGNFLGFAKATYAVDTGLFDQVSYQMSRYGASLVGSSGDQSITGKIDQEEVNDLADAISNVQVPEGREQSEDEINQIKEAQQKLKEAMKEQGEN